MTPPAEVDRFVVSARPHVSRPDGTAPAGFFVEDEPTRKGTVEKVATVLLAGRECPYRCVMCDLWKGTTASPVTAEALVHQVDEALDALPGARHLKLYNAGSFFDDAAVPVAARGAIAERARRFETLIVECHPNLVGDRVLRFRDALGSGTSLEVAMGLETAHAETLAKLNKRMTVGDYVRATRALRSEGIFVRTFVLLGTPFLPRDEGAEWTIRSIELAFDAGSDCVSVIPVRGGNGAMEALAARGEFEPPSLDSLAAVVRAGLSMRRGRVLADLWDLDRFEAGGDRALLHEELRRMNLTQQP